MSQRSNAELLTQQKFNAKLPIDVPIFSAQNKTLTAQNVKK